MKKIMLIKFLILFAFFSYGQDAPKIGDTRGIKEKFLLIKKGLPNLKKNLTKADPMWENERNVIFEMGNGIVLYEEYEKNEILQIKFSSGVYFSGTLDDFKNFYKKLILIISDVFTTTHSLVEENKENKLVTNFYEKGKEMLTTGSYIIVELSWVLDSPYITIIVGRKK